jgi:hypothetical protein
MEALQRLLASQDPEPMMSAAKPKVVYKQEESFDMSPIGVDGVTTEPEQPQARTLWQGKPIDVQSDVQPTPESKPLFSGMDPGLKETLIGLIPLGLGMVTGNTAAGSEASSKVLAEIDKRNREDAKLASKSSIQKAIEAMRLQRELAKNQRALATEKRLSKNNLYEIDKDGKPFVVTAEEAVGKQAYKNPGKDGLTDEEWRAREEYKAKLKADLEKLKGKLKKDEPLDPYKAIKSESDLARQYQSDSKITSDMGQNYTQFGELIKQPQSGARDLAAIFKFMKMLDPTSVVREGEQASAANAGAVPDSIILQYNRLLLGKDQKLPDGMVERFYDQASALYRGQLKRQASIDGFYKAKTGRYGLDHRNVIRPYPGAQSRLLNYSNPKTGQKLPPIDPSKLTQRMKSDLAKDGFVLEEK